MAGNLNSEKILNCANQLQSRHYKTRSICRCHAIAIMIFRLLSRFCRVWIEKIKTDIHCSFPGLLSNKHHLVEINVFKSFIRYIIYVYYVVMQISPGNEVLGMLNATTTLALNFLNNSTFLIKLPAYRSVWNCKLFSHIRL